MQGIARRKRMAPILHSAFYDGSIDPPHRIKRDVMDTMGPDVECFPVSPTILTYISPPPSTVTCVTLAASAELRTTSSTMMSTKENYCSSQPCQNGATCTDGPTTFTCSCMPGYTNVTCDIQINLCETFPCEPYGTCSDFLNGYTCSCNLGSQRINETYCTNIDECSSSPCLNNGTCVDDINRFKCTCPEGTWYNNCTRPPVIAPDVTADPTKEPVDIFPHIISNTSQLLGVMAGGGMLNFTGYNLNNFPLLGAYFIPSNNSVNGTYKDFQVLYGYPTYSDDKNISIMAPRALRTDYDETTFMIQFEFTNPVKKNASSPFFYQYIGNPTIQNIGPKNLPVTGGIHLTVAGTNFEAINNPGLLINIIINNATSNDSWSYVYTNSTLENRNSSQLIYQLPVFEIVPEELRRAQNTSSHLDTKATGQQTSEDGSLAMFMYLGFKLDNFPKYENISKSLPNVTVKLFGSLEYTVSITAENQLVFYDLSSQESIKMKGKDLNLINIDNYRVTIGDSNCKVLNSFTVNQLECTPPVDSKPDNSTMCDSYKNPNAQAVLVHIGTYQLEYFSQCVVYTSSSSIWIIIGPIIGVAVFLLILIIVVYIIVKKWRSPQVEKVTPSKTKWFMDEPQVGVVPGYFGVAKRMMFGQSKFGDESSEGYDKVIDRSGGTYSKSVMQGSYSRSMSNNEDPSRVASDGFPWLKRQRPFGYLVRPSNRISYTRPSKPSHFDVIVGVESAKKEVEPMLKWDKLNNSLTGSSRQSGEYSKAIPDVNDAYTRNISDMPETVRVHKDYTSVGSMTPNTDRVRPHLNMEVIPEGSEDVVGSKPNAAEMSIPVKSFGGAQSMVSFNGGKTRINGEDPFGTIGSASSVEEGYSRTIPRPSSPHVLHSRRDTLYAPDENPYARPSPSKNNTRTMYDPSEPWGIGDGMDKQSSFDGEPKTLFPGDPQHPFGSFSHGVELSDSGESVETNKDRYDNMAGNSIEMSTLEKSKRNSLFPEVRNLPRGNNPEDDDAGLKPSTLARLKRGTIYADSEDPYAVDVPPDYGSEDGLDVPRRGTDHVDPPVRRSSRSTGSIDEDEI